MLYALLLCYSLVILIFRAIILCAKLVGDKNNQIENFCEQGIIKYYIKLSDDIYFSDRKVHIQRILLRFVKLSIEKDKLIETYFIWVSRTFKNPIVILN